jgi:hypothetical protein
MKFIVFQNFYKILQQKATVGLDNQTSVALGIGYGAKETALLEKLIKLLLK